jgi:hypothetical protein
VPEVEPDPGLPSIPGYRVLGVLGRGGMGVVYHARQLEMDREVALKLISPGGRDEAAIRGRFAREVRSLARIEHPNIVPVYDAGLWQGFPYYTMKLVPRGPLSRHLERFGGDVRATARLVAKVARAVGTLHAARVLHRDLKPLNILLGDNDEPLVADFGLARWIGDESDLTESGSPVGTRPYMSPEQSLGSKTDYTAACDIWALGVVLFEVLTGRRPFQAEDPVELYLKIRAEPAPPASSLNPAVPPALDAVIDRCMAKRPEDRYATAEAVADDLERWLVGEPLDPATVAVSETRPETPPPPETRQTRRVGPWVALAALIPVAAVVLWAAFRDRTPAGGETPHRTIAQRLAARETVDLVTASGAAAVVPRDVEGFPGLFEWEQDGAAQFRGPNRELAMAEFIDQALPLPVKVEAEIAVRANTEGSPIGAGVYVGRKDWPGGESYSLVRVKLTSRASPPGGGPDDPPAARPVKVNEQTTLELVARRGKTHDLLSMKSIPNTFTTHPPVPYPLRWHRLSVTVQLDAVEIEWDGQSFPPIREADVVGHVKSKVPDAVANGGAFGPGIGVFAHRSELWLKNVRLVPAP